MKSRASSGGRRAAAAAAATADLFPPAPVMPPPTVAMSVPLQPHLGAGSRVKQLWCAAVFSDLTEGEPPANALLLWNRRCLSAQQFTPWVSLEMPDALLMEIRGSVKLFGSLDELHRSIDASWKRFPLPVHTAIAPTPLAALWLARGGRQIRIEEAGQLAGMLAELPIACTAWHPDWLQNLRDMGVTRIGELLRLPRAGVARRLSPSAVADIDVALGRQAAPRRPYIPRERFRERCDFETEIENVAYLQKALEPLIERCARFLRERQAGVQTLQLTLRHRRLPATRVRVRWASTTSERARLTDVFNQRLSRLELPDPVRGMQILSGSLQPLSPDSLDAFAGSRVRAGDTAPQLIERLRARLGDQAVYGVCSIPEHRPEAAWRRVHELHPASDMRVHDGLIPDMMRPVWLLGEPAWLSANLEDLLTQGLTLEQGPERIESGWWDGRGVARDYYIARQMRGARWWIFQERLSRSWYLHGVFA